MSTTTDSRVQHTHTEKGTSLARGPAHVLGTVLLICGLCLLYKQHVFPPFAQLPSHHVPTHKAFFGIFGANGWTGMLTAVAGGLLLFGAAQHLLAKTMSLIVAIGLGAAGIVALIEGNVLGMAAANIWTELGWWVAAAILLFNVAIPRRRRTVPDDPEPAAGGQHRIQDRDDEPIPQDSGDGTDSPAAASRRRLGMEACPRTGSDGTPRPAADHTGHPQPHRGCRPSGRRPPPTPADSDLRGGHRVHECVGAGCRAAQES